MQGGRQWQYDYNALGLLESIEDPLGRVTSLEYDAASRLTTQTLPGNRLIRFYYDRSGNVDSLTPPGKTLSHGFRYTGIDLNDCYSPPVVAGVPITATSYEYNRGGQLTAVERPDDRDLELAHERRSRSNGSTPLTKPRGGAVPPSAASAGSSPSGRRPSSPA